MIANSNWKNGNLLFIFPIGLGDAIMSLPSLYLVSKNRPNNSLITASVPRKFLSFFKTLNFQIRWMASENIEQHYSAIGEIKHIIDCSGFFITHFEPARLADDKFYFNLFTHNSYLEYGSNVGNFQFVHYLKKNKIFKEIDRINVSFFDPLYGESEYAFLSDIKLVDWALSKKIKNYTNCKLNNVEYINPKAFKTKSIKQICLCPCGSDFRKKWPDRFLITLIKKLIQKKYSIKIILGPDEYEYINKLHIFHEFFIMPKSILDLASEIHHSKFVIANDCGPMHLSGILDKPLLAIFGPTNPNVWFPYIKINQTPLKKKNVLLNKVNNIKYQWPEANEVFNHIDSFFKQSNDNNQAAS